jgi:hypothetical protein
MKAITPAKKVIYSILSVFHFHNLTLFKVRSMLNHCSEAYILWCASVGARVNLQVRLETMKFLSNILINFSAILSVVFASLPSNANSLAGQSVQKRRLAYSAKVSSH